MRMEDASALGVIRQSFSDHGVTFLVRALLGYWWKTLVESNTPFGV